MINKFIVVVGAVAAACTAIEAWASEVGAKDAYKKYAGIWALDCAKPDMLSADIQATTLTFSVNGKKIPTKNLESSVSTYQQEPNFQIDFSGEISKDVGADLEIWKDKKGLYGKLSGHPTFEKLLGGGAGKRLAFCNAKK